MPKIHLLTDILANQIAAGEVVERPASIVKELIENSLDAGADFIEITIEAGGKNLIVVKDNGCGMDEADAKLSLERYATSKVSNLNDIFHVQSFGFRGEALAAIASVSTLILKTREATSVQGVEVQSDGGKIVSAHPVGMSIGTEIEVQELFFNTPARRKYLKSDLTELNQIEKIVTKIALANPAVHFKLISNAKVSLDTPATKNLLDRITSLLGTSISKHLIPVDHKGLDYQITGFIAKPELSFKRRAHQYLFVNKRPIQDLSLAHAVTEAYHTLLFHGQYPVFVLLLDLDPLLVDVNVHPRKQEVRFVNQAEVYKRVKSAVSETLSRHDLNREITLSPKTVPANYTPYHPQNFTFHEGSPFPYQTKPTKPTNTFASNIVSTPTDYPLPTPHSPQALAQLHDSYILAQTPDSLLLLDQHAAHERIQYAKLMAKWHNQNTSSQSLTIPLNIDVPFNLKSILEENLEFLTRLGFQIEPFGGNTYLLNALPSNIKVQHAPEILLGTLEDLQGESKTQSIEEHQEKIINYIACRSAVKFNDQLSLSEQQGLIDTLESLESGYTCPHGRPVSFRLSLDELEKYFKRK